MLNHYVLKIICHALTNILTVFQNYEIAYEDLYEVLLKWVNISFVLVYKV